MKYKIYKNKITALLLTAVMLMGAVSSISVFGTETDSGDTTAVKFLTALGIMEVDKNTGKLWDDTPVRRAEMAEILCKLFDAKVIDSEISTFTDVRGEEKAYVETAVANGYMNGHGDGTFGPDEYILNEQLIKIFVSALGGGQIAEYMGGYPVGYASVAKRIGLTKNLKGSLSDTARRVDVAMMIYDAMHADVFEVDYMGTDGARYDRTKGETFLTEALDVYIYSGIVKKNEATALNRPAGVGEGYVQIGDAVLGDSKRLADDYLGCNVDAYVKKSGKGQITDILYIEEADNNIYVIQDTDIISAKDKAIEYYEGEKKKSVKLSSTPDMVYNGKAIDFEISKADVSCGFIKLIDNNDDNAADVIIVTEYATFVVNDTNAENKTISFKYGANAIDISEAFYRIYKDGSAVDFEEIAEGDVLLIAASEGSSMEEKSVSISISSDYVTGTVDKIRTASDGKRYITVSGVEYPIGEYCDELESKGSVAKIESGAAGSFRIDSRGYIADFQKNTSGLNLGYLIQSAFTSNVFSKELSVRIFTESNKIETYGTADKIIINGDKINVSEISADKSSLFATPQLVQFKAKDGILNEITFAKDEYSAIDFSKDIEKTLNCTNTSVLGDSYYVNSNTKVFIVPSFVTVEPAYYSISNGSYFVRDRNYKGVFYDVENDGKINYAVIKKAADESDFLEASPLLAVSAVGETVDADGLPAYSIEGMNEAGAAVTLIAKDKSYVAEISKGDIIRYRTDFVGCVAEVSRLTGVNDKDYSLSTLHSTTKYVKGEVGYKASDHLSVSGKAVSSELSPMDMIKIVYNNGKAMYRYNSDRGVLKPISFADIEYGDRIFACVNGANSTRMLVIYE